MEIIDTYLSSDGITTKLLQKTAKNEVIETTVVDRPEKRIICFSTQVGCSMTCSFCAVSKTAFVRNLTVEELIDQCVNALPQEHARPVLFSAMGVGEPLLNQHLSHAARALSAYGKIAVSTIGINPTGVVKFSERLHDVKLKLQLSVHAPTDELRREILDRRLPSIKDTIDILHAAVHPIEYNYVLLNEVNDSPEQAALLAELLRNANGTVKLNKYNNVSGSRYTPSAVERVQAFVAVLEACGIHAEQYVTDGTDIRAACGQMMFQWTKPTPAP